MMDGVRWMSVAPGSGYGDAGQAYISALRAAGVPVSWTPLGWPSHRWRAGYGPLEEIDGDHVHTDIVNRTVTHDTLVVHSTPLWHSRLLDEGRGRSLVAYTTWETDRLPPERVEILNRYDRVLVPSRFNAEVFTASGVQAPVRVVPHIVPELPPPSPRSGVRGRFTFYLIATWSSRKAIPDAVAAFLRAFGADEDVALVIHTTREDHVAIARSLQGAMPPARAQLETWFTLATILAGHRSVPEITLSTRALTRAELAELHRRCDCFVLLSHGEGWGLGAFEAAAAGNPVIVTGWGGTLEFLPDGYPYRVDYDLVPTTTAEPDSWWAPRPGEHWANARIDHAAALLRRTFEHRGEARAWGLALRSHLIASFSQERVAPQLLDALDCS